MSRYESNIDLHEAARLLGGASHVVVTAHAKPDGDAYGAVVALATVLRGRGVSVGAWLMPPVPSNLRMLRGSEIVQIYEPSASLGRMDLLVVLDTGAWSQLEPMRQELKCHLSRTMVVDHHLTGDVESAWRYIDTQAAACCELVAQLLGKISGGADPFDDAIVRDALFVGIAADTGWFRFPNTRPQTHELAARLLHGGVDHAGLFRQLEQAARPEKLALFTLAMASLHLLAQRRVAVMVLGEQDFRATGTSMAETEHLVDIPQLVGSVEVVALITERPIDRGAVSDRPIRISFRSKAGSNTIDVAKLAQHFGGGGHACAAGASLPGPLHEVVGRVKVALIAAVDGRQPKD